MGIQITVLQDMLVKREGAETKVCLLGYHYVYGSYKLDYCSFWDSRHRTATQEVYDIAAPALTQKSINKLIDILNKEYKIKLASVENILAEVEKILVAIRAPKPTLELETVAAVAVTPA